MHEADLHASARLIIVQMQPLLLYNKFAHLTQRFGLLSGHSLRLLGTQDLLNTNLVSHFAQGGPWCVVWFFLMGTKVFSNSKDDRESWISHQQSHLTRFHACVHVWVWTKMVILELAIIMTMASCL